MSQQHSAAANAPTPVNGVDAEQPAQHLEAAVSHARQLVQSLATCLGSATSGGLIREIEELARKQPSLALGGAFLLGMAAARISAGDAQQHARQSQPAQAEDDAPEHEPQGRPPFGDLREPAEPIGVGSPIGDAPYAGGSPRKGPL
jgi:hypothetical protein